MSTWIDGALDLLHANYFAFPALIWVTLAFSLLPPENASTIASMEVTCRILDPYGADHRIAELSYLCQSRIIGFGAYAVTSILLYGLRFFWWCTRMGLSGMWARPLMTIGVLTALYASNYRFKLMLNLVLGATTALRKYNEIVHNFRTWRLLASDTVWASTPVRLLAKETRQVITATFKLLGRTRYDELDAFEHPKMNPAKQIRLLDVRRNLPFLPIRAAMVVVDIDNPPEYEAVSYTWDPNPVEFLPVALNGLKSVVTI